MQWNVLKEDIVYNESIAVCVVWDATIDLQFLVRFWHVHSIEGVQTFYIYLYEYIVRSTNGSNTWGGGMNTLLTIDLIATSVFIL